MDHRRLRWRKAKLCANTECVEVARQDNETVLIRHSKRYIPLPFTNDEWNAFLEGVKNGDFDTI